MAFHENRKHIFRVESIVLAGNCSQPNIPIPENLYQGLEDDVCNLAVKWNSHH